MSGSYAIPDDFSFVPPHRAAYDAGMKLFRFRYSPYARKVQMVLDLLDARYELVEVPYSDRNEIARTTGGYIYVPVLVDDGGEVIVESRDICEYLTASGKGAALVPSPLEGPIWAYHDFADGPLEDVLFRVASPAVRDAWPGAGDRALYVLVKERKFGAGCVDAWEKNQATLVDRARHLLAPSLKTIAARPFLFGDAPTLADAALYGLCKMLEEATPVLLPRVAEELVPFVRRLEAWAAKARPST
jgi:glutathione S-transferase